MWKTSPPRPSETPDPGFRKGGTQPSGLKYIQGISLSSQFILKLDFIHKRYSTFYKHTRWDTQSLLVWSLAVACKSVHFDRGHVFLLSVEKKKKKQAIKTLKRLKRILGKCSICITSLLNLQSTSL